MNRSELFVERVVHGIDSVPAGKQQLFVRQLRRKQQLQRIRRYIEQQQPERGSVRCKLVNKSDIVLVVDRFDGVQLDYRHRPGFQRSAAEHDVAGRADPLADKAGQPGHSEIARAGTEAQVAV